MHVVTLLHKKLKDASIHASRLKVLMETSKSLLNHSKLTLTGLARGLRSKANTKSNINKMDSLIGNTKLYADRKVIYKTLNHWILGLRNSINLIVDWSSASPGERYQLLRASLAVKGRALTVYEEIHPLTDYNKEDVHQAFLNNLKEILPLTSQVTIITDAGFCVTWFKAVQALGWDFVGRVSNTSIYTDAKGEERAIRVHLSYNLEEIISDMGEISLTKAHGFKCYLQLYKKSKKYRVNLTINKERSARSVSVKASEREKQGWIIVSSVGGDPIKAKEAIRLYGFRMQIEESFRDLKSHQFGMGLEDSRSQGVVRLSNLLLIGYITSIMAWLIGICARMKKLQYQFQGNSVKDKEILSIFFLAREVVRKSLHFFRRHEWDAALLELQGY